MNYYNEYDPGAAAWLRELINQKEIPEGHVDTRSITEVCPEDLAGYVQCHFFAGIGGWAHALRLAGWPDDQPVWTGSCPCQPFSSAGKQKGTSDERHLWPEFLRLIAECRPATVFGEQVASRLGREWLSGVRSDLEGVGYAVGAADLCAAGVGAPHIRQRLYWVADAEHGPRRVVGKLEQPQSGGVREIPGQRIGDGLSGGSGAVGRLADDQQQGLEGHPGHGNDGNEPGRDGAQASGSVAAGGGVGGVADADVFLRYRAGSSAGHDRRQLVREEAVRGFWDHSILLPCRDGKARRVEPTIFPLAHGVSGRVGLLRGAGNAIVPQVAATFIEAFDSCLK